MYNDLFHKLPLNPSHSLGLCKNFLMTSSLHLVNGSTSTGANLDEVLCPMIAKVGVQTLVKPELYTISSPAQVNHDNARSAFVIHLLHPKFTFVV